MCEPNDQSEANCPELSAEQQPQQQQQQQCQFVKEEEQCRLKWLKLSNVTYRDPTGKERQWEAVARTTTSSGGVDAVVILAILRRMLKYDCMICVRQYRPPLHAYTIEFPAGLIDKDETPETAAVRELREETGYVATVKHCSPATGADPGLTKSMMAIVTTEIDGDAEENKHPKPQLDEGEFVEVLHIPVNDLIGRLNEYASHGDVVDSRVYSYAIAHAQATKELTLEPELK